MGAVEVRKTDLQLLVRALRSESDGKELKRDLVRGLKIAVEPAAAAARASILSMGTKGLSSAQPSLRSTVAAAVKVSVRTAGKRAGVRVVVKKHTMPRGFYNAPKRLNSKKGWRHPVFGNREVWVSQRGKPDWFDGTLRSAAPATIAAAKLALERVAQRISNRTRG